MIVLFAAAILAFDGVAVIVLGILAHRVLFTLMGVVMTAAAVATLWSWRSSNPASSSGPPSRRRWRR